MDVTPLVRKGQQIIQSYAGGTFKVSGEVYDHPLIVTPDAAHTWAISQNHPDHMTLADFEDVLALSHSCDVFLFGTGKTLIFLPLELKKTLKVQGLHLEMMDTGAACRTYNVLMAEGRRVAALLLPVA